MAGREQERACERQRVASATGCFCLSQSLCLSSLKCDQAKRRQITPALLPPLQRRKEAKDTHLFFFFSFTPRETLASGTVHTGGGGGGGGRERMLNNVTECEEGEVGANSQGE